MSIDQSPDEENVEIGNLPAEISEALRLRALENGRSIEEEVRSIIEEHLNQSSSRLD
jgi:plasmid stability protein